MNATRNAGMLRLTGLGSAAALALGALTFAPVSARAQGGASAGPLPARITVTKDTIRGERIMIFRTSTPAIDSLIRRQNGLPFGSAEYFALDSAIQAALRSLPRPTEFTTASEKVEIELSAPRVVLRGSFIDVIPQGWLGFTSWAYNRTWYNAVGNYVQYFEYPTVVAIEANSPASRAGVRTGDSLVAYNGLDVRANSINMTQLLTPGREVSVKLRRDGEAKELTLVVEKAPQSVLVERRAAAAEHMASTPTAQMDERRIVETQAAVAARGTGGMRPARAPTTTAGTLVGATTVRATPRMVPTQSGVLGAAMIEVDPGLASSLRGMEGKHGVLVTVVPEGSPADRAGIRAGDVILRVESSEVPNPAQLGLRLYRAEVSGAEKIKITLLRAGKTQDITYVPPR